MDMETALAVVKEFQERLTSLANAGPTPDFRVQQKILENDLDEFMKEAFDPDSPDYSKLDARLRPLTFGYGQDPWKSTLGDYRGYSEALMVIQHRLEKGQSILRKTTEPGEHVIEAGTPHSAYVKLREIVQRAKATVQLVDPYVGGELFALLSNAATGVQVEILTWKSKAPPDFISEAAKFTAEHGIPVEVRWGSEDFHDRFLLADDQLYMSGGSFKDWGKKLSFVTEVRSVKDTLRAELDDRWLTGTKA